MFVAGSEWECFPVFLHLPRTAVSRPFQISLWHILDLKCHHSVIIFSFWVSRWEELRVLLKMTENFTKKIDLHGKCYKARLCLSLVPSLTSFVLALWSHEAKQAVECLVATQYLPNRNGVVERQILLSNNNMKIVVWLSELLSILPVHL